MKKLDFIRYMGNINEKYVIESEKYRPVSRNWVKVTALAACIAIIATSIPLALVLNREDAQTDAPVATTPFDGENNGSKVDPLNVIYCSFDSMSKKEAIKNALNNKNTRIEEFVSYNSVFGNKYEMLEYSNDIPQTLSIALGNKTYNCTFDCVYNTKAILSTDETLRSYAKVAKYTIDGPTNPVGIPGCVYYCVATQEILHVSVANKAEIQKIEGSMTRDEIKSLAERDVKNLYGEKALSKYTMNIEIFTSSYCYITFTRYFGEFASSEKIELTYNTNGELCDLYTTDLRAFDVVEDDLSENILLQSEEYAMRLYDGKLVSRKYVTLNNDGKPVVYSLLKYEEDGELKHHELYYSVNIK